MAQRTNSLVLIAVAAALTGLAVALAREQRLGFVGACDWLYYIPRDQHHWPGVVYPLVLLLGFLAGVIALARRPERLGRPALAAALAALTLLAFLLHLAMDTVTPGGSAESVMAIPRSNVFYHDARRIENLDGYLFRYEAHAARAPVAQVRTHPPGTSLLYYGLLRLYGARPGLRRRVVGAWELVGTPRQGLDSAKVRALFARLKMDDAAVEVVACIAFTYKLLACLTVVPVYLLGAALHSRRAGVIAAAFAALLPAVHCFSPGLDQIYPLISATLCWIAWRSFERRSAAHAALFGLLFGVGMLFTLAFVVVLALVGLVAVAAIPRLTRRPGLLRSLAGYAPLPAAAALGFAAVVVLFWIGWNVDLFGTWARCLRANAAFNLTARRPYAASLLSNVLEYVFFMGLPLACLLVLSAPRAVRAVRTAWAPAAPVLCFLGLMLALNLSGANRGEVGRLWMFTLPLSAVAAAWESDERHTPAWALAALLAVQFAHAVGFRVCVDAFMLYST